MSTQSFVRLNAGFDIPQIGLGVWQTPANDTANIVRHAIRSGYRAVDTAMIYRNENGVGDALADHPDIFLTTKLWNDDQGYDAALRAFDASAAKLRRKTIDLYLIHWPAPKKGLYRETWKALVRLRDEGHIRAIGVSNFAREHLEQIIADTGVVPAVNQIELHPDFQQRSLREFHAEHGIATESWSPLGQGRILKSHEIEGIARKHGKSPAQIIIRWHIQSGLIVIPKSVTPSRVEENIAVFDFALDDDDLGVIAGMDSSTGRIGPDPMTANFQERLSKTAQLF